jgi:hypothetical protein
MDNFETHKRWTRSQNWGAPPPPPQATTAEVICEGW